MYAVICRGYNIGIRLIDEFLANSRTTTCGDFKETAEKIAKVPAATCILSIGNKLASVLKEGKRGFHVPSQVGFKMFLNTTASVTKWNSDNTECSLV